MTSVADIARTTAERHAMFEANSPVLVMVSGGGDSMALLRLLATGEFGSRPLRVLHVNHLLRDAEAEGDEAFVVHACKHLDVECRVLRYDVAAYAQAEGLNLEDAGRQVRYRFAEAELDALCTDVGAHRLLGRIAVAHTRDDRVETFFMRALFGAGAKALSSISPVRGRIVRPLLSCDRASVRAWLQEQGGDWREDASNADTSRLRAHIRADLVPAAEAVNPAFRDALERSMDLLSDDDALLSGMAEAFARDFAESRPGEEVAFSREFMRTLDRTMARRTVRCALLDTFPEASRLEAEHIEALVDGLSNDGFARDLPFGLRAFGEYDKMVILRSNQDLPVVAPTLLSLPGNADLGPAGSLRAEAADTADTSGSTLSVVVDASAVREFTVDGPRPGDRMRPFGMEGTRKVSDLLIDAKVPARIRPATPVVRDGERIVWVAGVRMSEEYRVGPHATRVVRLTWTGPEAPG